MTYADLIAQYPNVQRLFGRIYAAARDEGRIPGDLLAPSLQWLAQHVPDEAAQRAAASKVHAYIKYLEEERQNEHCSDGC